MSPRIGHGTKIIDSFNIIPLEQTQKLPVGLNVKRTIKKMYSLNCAKLGTVTLGLLALLAASGTAAQAQHGGSGRGGGGGMHGGQQGSHSLVEMALPAGIAQPLYSPKVLGVLNLTSDQRTAIAALLSTYETTAEPYQKEVGTDEAAAKALYEASTYDTATATSTAEDEATAIGNLILAAQAVQADIYTNVLTSTQQAAYVTAVTSSSSSSSSSSTSSDDSSSSSHTATLPTLAAMILRESTALSLTDTETTALQAIEAAQITSDTADLATVKSDLTTYTSAYNASTYDEDALTSAVDTAEGDIATLLENDWAAQSASFLTLTTAQQTTFLSASTSHGSGGNGGSGSGGSESSGSGSSSSSSGSTTTTTTTSTSDNARMTIGNHLLRAR